MTRTEAVAASPLKRAWRKLAANKGALVGLAIIAVFGALALLAPLLPIADPNATSWSAIRKAPSLVHPLGTDELGRDILARMIWGARASLSAGLFSVILAMVVGVPLGIPSGYLGGWFDMIVSRITEAFLAMPFLITAIALAAFLGPSLINSMIAIALSALPIFVRLTRGQVLAVKSEEYVEGARSIGLGPVAIMVRYIFPNVLPPILVQATLTVATAIIAEASLSFLGLGQQPPSPSWGSMLNVAKNFLSQAPWMAIWPGGAIFLVVVGFNLMGDGLRDALDPRSS